MATAAPAVSAFRILTFRKGWFFKIKAGCELLSPGASERGKVFVQFRNCRRVLFKRCAHLHAFTEIAKDGFQVFHTKSFDQKLNHK